MGWRLFGRVGKGAGKRDCFGSHEEHLVYDFSMTMMMRRWFSWSVLLVGTGVWHRGMHTYGRRVLSLMGGRG